MPSPDASKTSKTESAYARALKKIEECRLAGEKGNILSLGWFGLSSLPKEIGQLANLTTLYLQGNQLSSLPAEIGRLANLRSLFLYDNQLSSLPVEIGQLSKLTNLQLQSNQLSSLPVEIGQLSGLTNLYLHDNRLSNLPSEIGRLTNLAGLFLARNQLSGLPDEICHLVNLKGLVLDNNKLYSFPRQICRLVGLINLDLDGNSLGSLPSEIGGLTNLNTLYLSGNNLGSLPAEIGLLVNLKGLYVSGNSLSEIPNSIGELKNLEFLYIDGNQLSDLPSEIGRLESLKTLRLDWNKLNGFPVEMAQLKNLKVLSLARTGLSSIPTEIGQLKSLTALYFEGNQLKSLPAEIGGFSPLVELDVSNNHLRALPVELGQLKKLRVLNFRNNAISTLPECVRDKLRLRSIGVWGNPLPAELLKLSGGRYGKGTKLLKHLRLVAQAKERGGAAAPRRFDEAKLLLVGPGEVGKTWLLTALQGDVPIAVGSTKGIEIARQPLSLPHPAEVGRTLHLNCWDFGGQEHFQITHQIFFSVKAVYLLVWKPRTGFDPELVARLERIQLSSGKSAKVLIVATHADGSVPAVLGKEALKESFGELIWGFYETDSAGGAAGTGIAELRREIASAAAQLEGMDLEYLPQWHEARKAVLALKEPAVDFQCFASNCAEKGVDSSSASDVAGLMEIQGHAVYFADAADDADAGMAGENLVVLHPEWLAKAVGFVIEDKPTNDASGVLRHDHLRSIWREDKARDCPGYSANLHGYLLWLMWKFDIAYRQDDNTSLIPQLIRRNRPDDLYWTPSQRSHGPQATLICRVPHDPPMGLIPALTAAVHPLRRVRDASVIDRLDRNWREGFFLDTERRGEAYVELQDRELRIVVRDVYPANLLGMVLNTLEEIVKIRWPRLEMDKRVPCIGQKNGRQCLGTHRKSRLEEKRGRRVWCEECDHDDLEVDKMLDGFDAREEAVMSQLRELRDGQRDLLATAHTIFTALAPENEERKRAPNMFTILPDKGRWYQGATHESVRITCWCEHPDGPHPGAAIGSGEAPDYLLTMPNDWLAKASPYISWAAVLMKAFLPMGGSVLDQTLGREPGADLKEQIALMNDASKAIPTGKLELGERRAKEMDDGYREKPEVVALRHIHDVLLAHVKPDKRWGDLRPVQTKSGQILWLCAKHAAIQQPPVQEVG